MALQEHFKTTRQSGIKHAKTNFLILRYHVKNEKHISDIASDSTKISLYGKDPDVGNTGVWYKNKYDYEDELISTNRSLLFSMLF